MGGPAENGLILPRRLARLRHVAERRLHHLMVVFDNLQDPHNASAVLRSCDVFGVQNVYVIERDREFAVSKGVSHGCERWLTIHEVDDPSATLRDLKEGGVRILCADPTPDAVPLHDVDFGGKVALVFGNETHGVASETRDLCDGSFVIPMAGFSRSLNVSVAAAVTLSHATQAARQALGEALSDDPGRSEALLNAWVARETAAKTRTARPR